MTCIVGVVDKKKKKVIIGGDSAGVSGYNITERKDVKVFRNKDFIFGCTSSFRMIQLLRFSFKPPKVGKKDIFEYMCVDFVDAIRETFKKGGYIQKQADGQDKGGTFLVGYKNRLFTIHGDFQVGESSRGFDACGCGEEYALAAFKALDDSKLTQEEKILKSLEVATYFSSGVCGPYVMEST
jgi:ATP-dependent protease HslVU (ClpYQ) peptidase subunit